MGISASSFATRRRGKGVRWTLPCATAAATALTLAMAPVAEAKTNSSAADAQTTSPSDPYGLGYDPYTDMGSLSAITRMVGVQDLWNKDYLGRGVGVALIDTGVTPVTGLDKPGKVINGPDLSFDSPSSELRHLDSYGHGTHMASIIAGSDTVTTGNCRHCLNSSAYSDVTKFEGVAPGAHIVNVKVGASEGSVDVSQIVAAINWAVEHRNDPGLNIRVISLSYGTDSQQTYVLDPIAFAAENAWRKGVVVVGAGGNDGLEVESLASPAYNPNILAIGTSDANGTLDASDDFVPDWANHGTAERPVDVVAPGVRVLGLRVPGSVIDEANPNARVGDRFIRGSGTSQSTAVVAGLVAVVLERFPSLTPDEVKHLLRANAERIGSSGDGFDNARGKGVIDAKHIDPTALLAVPRRAASTPATGLGTLEAARGGVHVEDSGVELSGERDIFGDVWSAADVTVESTAGRTWRLGLWRTKPWSGDGWDRDGAWQAIVWDRPNWAGRAWTTTTGTPTWDGRSWTGSRWTGSRWTGSRWTGSRWTGVDWG